MKYQWNASAALIFAVIIFLSFSSMVSAGNPAKTFQLNLSLPQESKEEPDPFTEKYEEVMREIAISDEAAEVVDCIKSAVEDVQDLTLDITVTEIRDRRNEEVVLHMQVSVEHRLGRAEFAEPSAVRGMIVLADQENLEVWVFQPVTNVIVVRGMEDASKEAMAALSIGQNMAQLTDYFDFSEYNVEIIEKTELEGVTDYLLKVDAPEDEVWYVRVKDDSWFPHEITVYEGETLQGTMQLSNVVLNPGISVEEIRSLPDVKVERI